MLGVIKLSSSLKGWSIRPFSPLQQIWGLKENVRGDMESLRKMIYGGALITIYQDYPIILRRLIIDDGCAYSLAVCLPVSQRTKRSL